MVKAEGPENTFGISETTDYADFTDTEEESDWKSTSCVTVSVPAALPGRSGGGRENG